MGRPRNTPADVWKYVDVRGDDECWEWQSYRDKDGYGTFTIWFKVMKAHRVVLSNVMHVPDDMLVCHSCDNPACCNPKHLFLGTIQDNNRDKVEKGRSGRCLGEKHGHAKLSADKVKFIRRSNLKQQELADMFGVSRPLISMIKNKKVWGHIA